MKCLAVVIGLGVSLSGCAGIGIAYQAANGIFGAGSTLWGLKQRSDALDKQDAMLAEVRAIRTQGTPQIRTVSERLREELLP
jgi:hypothetical protein